MWTRRWWEIARDRYELVTSDAVLDELREGKYPSREPALALVAALPILEITPVVAEIVAGYVRHRLMPAPLEMPCTWRWPHFTSAIYW